MHFLISSWGVSNIKGNILHNSKKRVYMKKIIVREPNLEDSEKFIIAVQQSLFLHSP